ncbi:cupin domain-containing protein [Microbulbifer flavimaris]|uniref:Cupin domain-containing protein n=1 Tax=Microbulbifer flavimaris TaxID=1781068 RepID=A0ABX4I4Y0_9GAMM|nr:MULTISPECIES: cupin domain-containing protein [Microbulbifer]PCO06574.1 cupin domain-containing protein [Microbulbifer flavimaris]
MTNVWTVEKMAAERLVRYQELKPCRNAFVDTYTPGSDQKENFTIIGPGVAEHPDQHVHIAEPHGFNIGGARQPNGCLNSQHSHETEEVFIVHSGRWAFRWGEYSQDGEAVLEAGDCISIPPRVFRGFENVGDGTGYLFAVLGRDDPGRVTWAPDVFEKARDYGLVLLEDGRLVDTTKGEKVPAGVQAMKPTDQEMIDAHRRMTLVEMSSCVVPYAEQTRFAGSDLAAQGEGMSESPLIGMSNPEEGIAAPKLAWRHGFALRRFDFAQGGSTPTYSRAEEEVIYLFRGSLTFVWDGGELALEEGDVLTVPKGLARSLASPDCESVAYIVRGADYPAAAALLPVEAEASVA